ncbi:sialidase family protein [Saccharopolyspora sp. NFXS83]|uniref:sialidase family protein n=1 Tax=Saccharopolyspora sp. NFXS83 TaxID=2993560 RepID=UPI00224B6FAB|nr:sialidase family protein [Saccharopolyspora sp. NFXS83]MCX2730508.1 sialidase family protein [Saccharopolyspora sp. NFXS83]
MRGAKLRTFLLCAALVALALPTTGAASPAATGTPLSDDMGLYPTSVRLQHAGEASGTVLAATVSFGADGGAAPIYESTDEGVTFTEVGRISDPSFETGLCCGSMLELPRQVGELPAGTLLWTASVGANEENRRMHLPVFQSRDQGRTWSYLSTCGTASGDKGFWEPELAVDANGALGCYFADENDQPAHSQVLRRTASTDGVNWAAPENVVALENPGQRPGMPVIRRLPDDRYYFSYEICGTGDAYDCAAYFRVSEDGSNWGDPAEAGTLLALPDGRFFAHAPKITVVGDGTPDGKVVTVGQELKHPDGTVAEGNGATLFVSDQPGSGDNAEIAAPVQVPGARNEPCPNYSSSLTPLADTAKILEIATDYDENDTCRAYYATGDL